MNEIQRIRLALGWASKIGNPKNSFGTRMGFKNWKSKEFVSSALGWALKIGNPKNSFGSRVTSEEWKSKEFVQYWGNFRRMEKTKFRSVFSLRFLGVEYTGLGFWLLDVEYIICFNFQFLGFGYMGFDFWLGFGYMGKFPLQIFGWVSLSDFCQIAE
ncbi:hypothetical protein RIR_jg7641.t1 [Rhizophagus irregularis DAOM 181602=DAOM 197198]|nr:hypothetical protein RIR_jg7641.t1 [Rhizophagus irregularis DAOM 181602=DAOM 197198]